MDKTKFRPIGVENDKADNSVIALVESGTTASRAYAIGAHFIRDGAFCTAKTAIAQGETFRLNTNYTAGNVGSSIQTWELVNIGANTYGSCVGYKNINLRLAFVRWTGNGTVPPSGGYSFSFNLPSGFLVSENALVPVRNGDSMEIRSEGIVRIVITNYWSATSIMYPTRG